MTLAQHTGKGQVKVNEMSQRDIIAKLAGERRTRRIRSLKMRRVDLKLEVVVIPVSDVDRREGVLWELGWRVDAERKRAGLMGEAKDGVPTENLPCARFPKVPSSSGWSRSVPWMLILSIPLCVLLSVTPGECSG